jgi:serine/threonine-protein kinase HipA
VDEILAIRRGVNFYLYLIGRFASFSGISGVRPNFLVRDQNGFSTEPTVKRQLSASFRSPTHIVKFWDEFDFPQLAANEFFCLNVAEECGLEVPPHRLARLSQFEHAKRDKSLRFSMGYSQVFTTKPG